MFHSPSRPGNGEKAIRREMYTKTLKKRRGKERSPHTFEDESGLANASWTVEDEGLRDSVVLSMIVEHRLHQWPWYDPPWFAGHVRLRWVC